MDFMLFSGDLNSVERAKERVGERFAAIYYALHGSGVTREMSL